MFYFEICDCPKCGKKGTFLPSFEVTLNDFLSIYDQGALLVLNEDQPPTIPDYIIFSCSEEDCSFQKKMSDQEALTFLREGWAKMAWAEWQKSVRSAAEFDKHFTRYILDGSVGKFISEKDIQANPLIRDYIRVIRENGKKKRIKISDDS